LGSGSSLSGASNTNWAILFLYVIFIILCKPFS